MQSLMLWNNLSFRRGGGKAKKRRSINWSDDTTCMSSLSVLPAMLIHNLACIRYIRGVHGIDTERQTQS